MLATNTVSGRLFRSFLQRNYRMLWFSDGATSSAEQMEILVLAWFVLIETDSAFLVGVYGALRFTGTLFAPFYGILVDRYDRLSLLRIARVIFTVNAIIIAALAFAGQIHIWQIFLLTGINGMARAFDNVTRQTLMADMVPRYNLGNAIALTRTGRDATQIVSPVIGGFLLDSFGLGWAYVAIIALLALGAALTLTVNPPPRRPATRGESIFSTLWDSFRYAWGNKVILALLLLANEIMGVFLSGRMRYALGLWPLLSLLVGHWFWRTRRQNLLRPSLAALLLALVLLTGVAGNIRSSLPARYVHTNPTPPMHLATRELRARMQAADKLLVDQEFRSWPRPAVVYLEPFRDSLLELPSGEGERCDDKCIAAIAQEVSPHADLWLLFANPAGDSQQRMQRALLDAGMFPCDTVVYRQRDALTLTRFAGSEADCD